MPRGYRHIQQFEKGIISLRNEGMNYREKGERLVYSKEQIKGYFKREHKKAKEN